MTAEHSPSNDDPQASPAPSRISELKCPDCDGTGNQGYKRGIQHPCGCPLGKEYIGFNRRFDRLWSAAGIPQRFEYVHLSREHMKPELIKLLEDPYRYRHLYPQDDDGDEAFYANHETRGYRDSSWLLWGKYGTGKTCAAVALAREMAIDHSEQNSLDYEIERLGLKFVTLPDMLSELRDTYNQRGLSEGDVMRKYQDPYLLILDDLGAEHVKDMDWLRDRLFQLIGHRHAAEYPTIFTSNLSPEELGERLGERVMWRLVEMCGHIVHFDGPNLRIR